MCRIDDVGSDVFELLRTLVTTEFGRMVELKRHNREVQVTSSLPELEREARWYCIGALAAITELRPC